ncbi:hypothetical protein C8R45DRAFT_1057317 [Mycena sanguinolenta]|nr:hypothetical protein C8R45DRAFT_1057317 [Mycena sanguinolenta]
MVFAGDFGQLPPVNATPLFSGNHEADPLKRSRMKLSDQKTSIGKMIWQQVTTAVILKQNMRQTTDSSEDTKFRTALDNMRYASCTAEDIQYLVSRTVGNMPGRPTFTDKALHNVSVITALNSHKDKINELGSVRFAAETNQKLTETNGDHATHKRPVLPATVEIPKRIQEFTTTYNVPGKISICVGMLVMIRHNEATELCITKGQEARVVGWHSSIGTHKKPILESLFVELIDPPRTIAVPGLPVNVVVLTARKQKTWCNLPDDSTVQITRSQIPVLPNFAMTDYSSQGKTRQINVVDLNNCRTHFSFYTALSRGTSSEGTIILQEFRELEALNEITRLRYEGQLPASVRGVNRRQLLTAFHSWSKAPFELKDVHEAIKSLPGELPVNALPILTATSTQCILSTVVLTKQETVFEDF